MFYFNSKYGVRLLKRGALPLVVVAAFFYSCASVGTLGGGDYDETPPKFLKGNPAPGELNASRKRVTIEFDEYLKLDKPQDKIVISPPQVKQANVRAVGKKVQIDLQDTLIPNTTYTIDFGDAIQDNNEGNPLENFVYTFSTGEQLDSMEVSGTVLNARNLEPIKGMMVGLHVDLADSAFKTKPFDRVGRTDSRGKFTIKGVAPGEYHIFALTETDQNYYYSQSTETVAFRDSLIIPSFDLRMRQDTTWIDSLVIDTIVERQYTHYLPDDLILKAFVNHKKDQRLAKSERTTKKDFSLFFTAPADTFPTIRGLNFDETDAFVIEKLTERIDTLKYWIKDSLIYQLDTLEMEVTYLYTDTLKQLVPRTDTLKLAPKEKPKSEKELKKEQEAKEKEEKERREKGDTLEVAPKIEFLTVDIYAPSSIDVYDYLTLTFPEPVLSLDSAAFHLKQKVDTLWNDIPFELQRDTLDVKVYNVYGDWKPGESYAFEVDSAAVTGIYGRFIDKQKKEFKAKTLDSYGQVFFNIVGAQEGDFVELLDTKDEVVRTVDVENGRADFYYLNPGKYAARLVRDTNRNGMWDTGNYEEKIQPEDVFYYKNMIEFKANFDVLQDWDLNELTLDRQKPDDIKKQKPDNDKDKNKNRNRNNNNNNRNTNNRNTNRR
ncbi:MAG: Ig-like domain-containing protein [Bacteroidaceae bacterium]|nr:Ig-like domain-containing protein [Bacteroidaceae bacterium]